MKKFILSFAVLAITSLGFAQTSVETVMRQQREAASMRTEKKAAQAAIRSPFATANCSFTFTSGSGLTFLKYCVTVNGNITLFESPQDEEHIAVGQDGEGYGICDLNTNVGYYDYAEFGDSGNWNPPTVVSRTAKSVKIARTTNDGLWTLTQTINQIAGPSPSAKIIMALKNNSAISKTALLIRYANADAANTFENNLDSTLTSAFAWNSISNGEPFGLMLQNVGTPQAGFLIGFVQKVPNGPQPCTATAEEGPLKATDGAIAMGYELILPKNGSRTVNVAYKSF